MSDELTLIHRSRLSGSLQEKNHGVGCSGTGVGTLSVHLNSPTNMRLSVV